MIQISTDDCYQLAIVSSFPPLDAGIPLVLARRKLLVSTPRFYPSLFRFPRRVSDAVDSSGGIHLHDPDGATGGPHAIQARRNRFYRGSP